MLSLKDSITLNAEPKFLTREITIEGLKIDPFTNGFLAKESSFSLRPSLHKGIHFVIGNKMIPYDAQHMSAIDGVFGRMLRISDSEDTVQVMIVEHLLSALQLLGLTSIEIHLDKRCYAEFLSEKAPQKIAFKKPTYIIPICGPGVSGYIEQIEPYCKPSGEKREIFTVEEKVFLLKESVLGKYRGVVRELVMEPSEKFEIEILSAQQPDINNNPDACPFSVQEGQDLRPFLKARPIMRLDTWWKEWVVYIMSLRSFALTPETYFKSRPGLLKEEVVARMHRIFQESQNEHLAHTAMADFPAELGAFTGGKIIKGKFILKDTNHVFRLRALQYLLGSPR